VRLFTKHKPPAQLPQFVFKLGKKYKENNKNEQNERLQIKAKFNYRDPDYDGLAILDWERWRPLFDLNWSNRKIYKDYSIKLITDKYPKMALSTATYIARYTFDKAAK
jgi:hypothetical protein